MAEAGAIGTWATSLFNIFVPYGSIWAQTWIFYLHLIMEHFCACTNLWLYGLDNSQFMTERSVCMATWRHVIKHWFIHSLLRHSSRPKAISWKKSSYLWRAAILCLCCDLQTGLANVQREFLSVTVTSSIIAFAGSYGLSSRGTYIAVWIYCRAFSCS